MKCTYKLDANGIPYRVEGSADTAPGLLRHEGLLTCFNLYVYG